MSRSSVVQLSESMTTPAACEAFINGLGCSVMKLGTDRMRQVMAVLDNPQDRVKTIHVVGTNGKGSTSAMLASVYGAAGYRTGLFTSPHLVSMQERIQLQSRPTSAELFVASAQAVCQAMQGVFPNPEDWLTYFEFLNAMAFWLFAQQDVDIAVIEAGLGGRLDSTNILARPEAVVVTPVSLDHMAALGETVAEIASEKAGVIHGPAPVILAPQVGEAEAVLRQQAQAVGAPVRLANSDHLQLGPVVRETDRLFRQVQDLATGQTWLLGLLGRYQRDNMGTVFQVVNTLASVLPVSSDSLAQGLRQVSWPGRFQVFPQYQLVIDGSHNPAGFATLLETLSADFPGVPVHWGLTQLANRPLAWLRPLLAYPAAAGVNWLIPPENKDFRPVTDLASAFDKDLQMVPVVAGLPVSQFCMQPVPTGHLKVLTGSLYTAGLALGDCGLV